MNAVSNLLYVLNDESERIRTTLTLHGRKQLFAEAVKYANKHFPNLEVNEGVETYGGAFEKLLYASEILLRASLRLDDVDRDFENGDIDLIVVGRSAYNFSFVLRRIPDGCTYRRIYYWLLELPVEYYLGRSIISRRFYESERFVLELSSKLIVPNAERMEFLINNEILRDYQQIGVVHNFPRIADVLPQSQTVPPSFPHNSEQEYIVFSGSVENNRFPLELFDAVERIYGERGVKLIVAGPVSKNISKQFFSAIREKDGIVYAGVLEREELYEMERGALFGLAFYLGSNANHLYCAPQKIFEYILENLPIMSSRNKPLQSLIYHNGLGCCVNPNKPESLYKGITEILSNHREYKKNVELWKSKNLTALKISDEIKSAFDL